MKKLTYLMLIAIAIITVVSCSNEDFASNPMGPIVKDNPQIVFNPSASSITRADLYGAEAAARLNNKFVVYGVKHEAAENETANNDAVVFKNFQVEWNTASAGTTESNTSDWEFVGKMPYTDNGGRAQTSKYWDNAANYGYTFYAFSSSDISYPADATNDKVIVTKTTSDATSLYNKGYSVTIKPEATLSNLYFSDRVEIPETDYEKPVTFTFRNISAKVRVGFYETIPGYSVQIDRFYIDNDATAAVTDFAEMNNVATGTGFSAALQNVKRDVSQNMKVTYYDNTDAIIENRPMMAQPDAGYYYSMNLGNGLTGTTLGTTSSNPTWDKGGEYTSVFPFEGNSNPMLVKLDFTITAEDGTDEVIHVRGARAIVPADFVQWKSNFAYTYLFKISDKTNGTTGDVDGNNEPTDPVGLKPITFDAIMVDAAEEYQQTITTFSSNFITTYALGTIANDYNVGQPIYVAISNNTDHSVITPSAIGDAAGEAQVYKLSRAASVSEVYAKLTGLPTNGLTLTALTTPAATIASTIPLVDGTNPAIPNVKFTPSAVGVYAYVYTTAKYVAPTYVNQGSATYDNTKTYYMQSANGVYYVVSVPNADAFNENKAKLYLQTAPGTPGVFDIKVIQVE